MENQILIEYLKQKGLINTNTKDVVTVDNDNTYTKFFHEFRNVVKDMPEKDKHVFVESLKHYGGHKSEECTTEMYVKNIVSKMSHIDNNGLTYSGEYFTLDAAREICDRYKYMTKTYISYTDMYIAVNTQYHDYIGLYKKWFVDDIDSKIIESAIVFWFCDSDYTKQGSKLWNYFKN